MPAIVYFEKYSDTLAHMRVTDDDHANVRHILNYAYSVFSYFDKAKSHTWSGQHGWDDCTVEFYNRYNDTIPIGLIPRLTGYIQERYSGTKVRLSKDIRDMFTPPHGEITMDMIEEYASTLDIHDREKGTSFMPFDHQYRLAYLALNRRRCSLLACTSAGKSLAMMIIARYLVEKENKKVLIIVPSKGLVVQLYDNFYTDYGWDQAPEYCSLIYSNSKDKISKAELEQLRKMSIGEEATLKQITISTWQSLQRKDPSYFKVFDAVLVDEAHCDRGEKLRGIVENCINANNFKVGVSGTLPEVSSNTPEEDCIDAGYIEGNLGPKIDVVHLNELINKGVLTPVRVKSIFVPYPNSVRPSICSSKCKYQDEVSLMVNNGSRKDIMDMLINAKWITPEQNTVMLYKGKENLYIMRDYLKEHHPEFSYHVIEGEVDVDDRESIRKELEQSVGNIIVATYGCMKQGVNIKLLNNLVFAEPGKSEYMIMQSVGRVVRKHPSKTEAVVYDIVDDASYYSKPRFGGSPKQHLNYMMQHYYIRMKYYAKEDIPIEETHLDGVFEAKITPDDVRKKKAAAVDAEIAKKEKREKRKSTSGKANSEKKAYRPTFFR